MKLSPSLVRVIPFGLYIAFLALIPSIGALLPDPRWLYALQVSCVLVAMLIFSKHYTELRSTVSMPDVLLAVLVGTVVFIAWINLDVPLLSMGEAKGFDPRNADGALNFGLITVRIFGAAIVVPVMEELFWRSYVMRWIDQTDFQRVVPSSVSTKALFLSSIVFGFEHGLWFAGIAAGLAYAWLYKRTENLWVPIIAHAVTNFMLGVWVVWSGHWQFW